MVGAVPAGLMLSHLPHLQGIESVVLKARSQKSVEERIGAGVLEQGTADLLVETGVGERMKRDGMVHHGIELRFGGRAHRIDLSQLTGGSAVTIYAQHEVIKELIAAPAAPGGQNLFLGGGGPRPTFSTTPPPIHGPAKRT